MENLIIKSFPIINPVNITIDSFNIITGEQGTGKSIICKLVYYFRTVPEKLIDSAENCIHDSTRNSTLSQDFYKIFFGETIKNSNIDVTYLYESGESLVIRKKAGISKLSFSLSTKLNAHLQQTKRYSQQLKLKSDGFSINSKDKVLKDQLRRTRSMFFGENEYMTIYIPAGRNSYSQVDAIVYDLLNSKFDIDEMLKAFFATYKNFMKIYQRGFPFIDKDDDKNEYIALEKKLSKIIKGKIHIEKESIFLIQEDKNNKIKLPQLYLSSGQLEILPIAIVLSTLFALIKGLKNEKIRVGSGNYNNLKVLCIIEEPEAHLFPGSQKEIMDIFGYLSAIFPENLSFFITSHSPYILTSINILLLQGKLNEQKKLKPANVGYINSNISALYIENTGKIQNIYDKNVGLIDPMYIGTVSENIDNIFSKRLYELSL